MIETLLSPQQPFYRVITPRYAKTPLSGAGAAAEGGRFNRPGQEALYLSVDAHTALLEYQQDAAFLPPGTVCTFLVDNLRVADLRAGYTAANWSLLWQDFTIDWRREWFNAHVEPVTWEMADEVLDAGLDGLLFPSQAAPGGTNLVIYNSSARPVADLLVYDPQGKLR